MALLFWSQWYRFKRPISLRRSKHHFLDTNRRFIFKHWRRATTIHCSESPIHLLFIYIYSNNCFPKDASVRVLEGRVLRFILHNAPPFRQPLHIFHIRISRWISNSPIQTNNCLHLAQHGLDSLTIYFASVGAVLNAIHEAAGKTCWTEYHHA